MAALGLLLVMTLARDAGLQELADQWLLVPTNKGANAGLKTASLVAGMTPARIRPMTWLCCATAG